ncbi:CU044_5270 family protein [Actinoallomurus spadix]|uniref:CU044_5270 family protein n=1 Tax=Actinoallomurus spadix TaxID=79912 RepID=A0ABP3GWV6_9ACTN|nr:CU044_5270 family protein [Actinoallomurus spadix]MCO5986848.1 CU044_5270 family protein [Actinoallomurus spadix]
MTRTADPTHDLRAHLDAMAEDGYRRRRDTDLSRTLATAREPARSDRRALPVRNRRPVLLLAGAAAVVALGTAVVPGAVSGHRSGHESGHKAEPGTAVPRTLDAKTVLLTAAETVAKEPAPVHGRFWYTRTQVIDRARQPGGGRMPKGGSANGMPRRGPYYPFTAFVSITWENWVPYRQGDTTRTVDKDLTTSFASPADEAAWKRAGSPSLTDMKPYSSDSHLRDDPFLELGPRGTQAKDLSKLPTTPNGLKALIEKDWKAQPATQRNTLSAYICEMAENIIDAPVTPATRAAAYRLFAAQPGVRVAGGVRDRLGRPGVALATRRVAIGQDRKPRQVEVHVIIDRRTAKILGSEKYDVVGGAVAHTPSSITLLTGSGWTDRLGVPARG